MITCNTYYDLDSKKYIIEIKHMSHFNINLISKMFLTIQHSTSKLFIENFIISGNYKIDNRVVEFSNQNIHLLLNYTSELSNFLKEILVGDFENNFWKYQTTKDYIKLILLSLDDRYQIYSNELW